MADWLAQASAQGITPEQALALIGLGLVQKLSSSETGPSWVWSEAEDGGHADLAALRQRLELTRLAIQTGAPLSTAEVTALLGARPGSAVVERGGLRARRLSRNVWKLSTSDAMDADADARDTGFGGGFQGGLGGGFRRRL
ncbi:hypothetical protein [Cyanobium sp. CH-040]|uniref:hypothetical protein n=1 Tax=Cyanobium sp. CH-040 TaxID=2823708 RepID=UPI0020CD748D|nr:hypothetical protein [Cyanobium sp. CH-040]